MKKSRDLSDRIVHYLGVFALAALFGTIGLSMAGKSAEGTSQLASAAIGALAGGFMGHRIGRSQSNAAASSEDHPE